MALRICSSMLGKFLSGEHRRPAGALRRLAGGNGSNGSRQGGRPVCEGALARAGRRVANRGGRVGRAIHFQNTLSGVVPPRWQNPSKHRLNPLRIDTSGTATDLPARGLLPSEATTAPQGVPVAPACPSSRPSCSNYAQQEQDNQKGQNQAQSATWIIAPTPAVRPGGEGAEQHQNEQNHQDSS